MLKVDIINQTNQSFKRVEFWKRYDINKIEKNN